MYGKYRDRAHLFAVYIREAHPTDEWQMDSNVDQGVCYPQPRTLEERLVIALYHYEELTLKEIGVAIHLTRERVRQIEGEALATLVVNNIRGILKTVAVKAPAPPFVALTHHSTCASNWVT
mgnify:CR=1 FL=1